jgi:hypothetical protein
MEVGLKSLINFDDSLRYSLVSLVIVFVFGSYNITPLKSIIINKVQIIYNLINCK